MKARRILGVILSLMLIASFMPTAFGASGTETMVFQLSWEDTTYTVEVTNVISAKRVSGNDSWSSYLYIAVAHPSELTVTDILANEEVTYLPMSMEWFEGEPIVNSDGSIDANYLSYQGGDTFAELGTSIKIEPYTSYSCFGAIQGAYPVIVPFGNEEAVASVPAVPVAPISAPIDISATSEGATFNVEDLVVAYAPSEAVIGQYNGVIDLYNDSQGEFYFSQTLENFPIYVLEAPGGEVSLGTISFSPSVFSEEVPVYSSAWLPYLDGFVEYWNDNTVSFDNFYSALGSNEPVICSGVDTTTLYTISVDSEILFGLMVVPLDYDPDEIAEIGKNSALARVLNDMGSTGSDEAPVTGIDGTDNISNSGADTGVKLKTTAGLQIVLPPSPTISTETAEYTVARGDSLSAIAKKYGVSVDNIKAENEAYFNNLAERNAKQGTKVALEAGVVLYITTTRYQAVEYTVQSGNTLQSIAYNYYGSQSNEIINLIKNANKAYFEDLAARNKAQKTSVSLEAGAVLTLPAGKLRNPVTQGSLNQAAGIYTVKSGDTLGALAGTYYGSVSQWKKIYEANKDYVRIVGSSPMIYVGQWLVIPE